jgi:tRNA threonylcarbamoyladenosine biosynthesis protein TsaE
MDTITLENMVLKQVEALGRVLGRKAIPGDIFCLDGELGAGKTTLTQAIAHGAGVSVKEYVTSPSFALLHVYQGRLPLYHFDFYRLEEEEIEELGFTEYLYGEGLSVVEWSRKATGLLPQHALRMELQHLDAKQRTIVCHGEGTRADLVAAIKLFAFESKQQSEDPLRQE